MAHPKPCRQHESRRGRDGGASLGNLLGCAEALKEATKGQYSKGIRAAMKAMENAKLDFKATIDRVAVASKWKEGTIEGWVDKGEKACADLMEKAVEVLKKAEEREEAEAKIFGSWRGSAKSWRA